MRRFLILVSLASSAGAGLVAAAPATADSCANAQFRTGPGAALPDCRAYEQASPVDKNGTDLQGYANDIQASTDGHAITFVTHTPLPEGDGSQNWPFYIAQRGTSDWSTA